MLQFNPSDPDHILLAQDLWNKMRDAGDLEDVFMLPTTSYHLMNILAPPNYGFMSVDEDGVWMMAWFSSWMNSAWMGLWVREDKRKTKELYQHFTALLEEAFKVVPVIMAVTKLPAIIEMQRKMGYDISIVVPELYGDKPGWIMSIHKDQFEKRKNRKTEAVLEVA